MMLSHFHPDREHPLESLQGYMELHLTRWDNSTTARFVITGILAGVMIYLLMYHRDTRWAESASITFISAILAVIIHNWLNFEDRILLYDIERAFRDQEGSD